MKYEVECTPEQLIKLKALGFHQDSNNSLPTQEVATRWLREAKGIWINICISACGDTWEIYQSFTYDKIESDKRFATYDQALSDSIDSALQLIEKQSNK